MFKKNQKSTRMSSEFGSFAFEPSDLSQTFLGFLPHAPHKQFAGILAQSSWQSWLNWFRFLTCSSLQEWDQGFAMALPKHWPFPKATLKLFLMDALGHCPFALLCPHNIMKFTSFSCSKCYDMMLPSPYFTGYGVSIITFSNVGSGTCFFWTMKDYQKFCF